jgi:hypothetical protein
MGFIALRAGIRPSRRSICEVVLKEIKSAKELVQSVMEELRLERDAKI